MSDPWFSVIGMGDDGPAGLGDEARTLIATAEIIIASRRLTALLPKDLPARLVGWPSPFDPMVEELRSWKGKHIVILTTGDPMWFGAGVTLRRYFAPEEMRIIPSPSAFSLAAARLGWPLQDVRTVSLHGRPLSAIAPLIQPGARIIALTSGADAPSAIAERLCDRGYGESEIHVLNHMGGARESHQVFRANAPGGESFATFHTVAINCIAEPSAPLLPASPGLPDDAFSHDGQITKREVRAISLAALAPAPGALLWDIGAGCGSIAIEWLRSAPGARAIAFEQDAARLALIRENAENLGTPQIEVIEGTVPATLEGQETPDAVFVGGAVSDRAVLARAIVALAPGGRLVANAVTLEGEQALKALHGEMDGELVQIAISHAEPIGSKQALRPRMPVTQWRYRKP